MLPSWQMMAWTAGGISEPKNVGYHPGGGYYWAGGHSIERGF